MIHITPGIIMTGAGCIGILGCLVGLTVTAVILPRQSKRRLERLETE